MVTMESCTMVSCLCQAHRCRHQGCRHMRKLCHHCLPWRLCLLDRRSQRRHFDLDAGCDGAAQRYRRLSSILGHPKDKVEEQGLLLAAGEEPATFEEAMRDVNWKKVMLDEMGSIEQNQTWTLVSLPPGHKAIGLKWIFKLKRDEKGEIIKHKARLVARGYVQKQGVDYDEVFAPVARMESIRMLLVVAAQEKCLVHHMDVKSAFLNENLNEVYVSQPPKFVAAGHELKVLKLSKALYDLKQAPRA
jgi:hypothetical protein